MAKFSKVSDSASLDETKLYTSDLMKAIATLIKEDKLIENIDEMLPKAGPHVKLSCGPAIALIIARILSAETPKGLCHLASWLKATPIFLQSLGISIEGGFNSISRYTLADTLERIYDYNANEFLVNCITNSVDEAQKEECPVRFNASLISENESDIAKFQEFCKHNLENLQKLYPNIKYLAMNSAPTNVKALIAAKDIGTTVFTKLNLSTTQDELAELCQNQRSFDSINISSKTPKSNKKSCNIKYKFLGVQELKDSDGESIPVLKCGFFSEALLQEQINSINQQAQTELEQVQSLLKKLENQVQSKEEALREFEKITTKVKFCSISSPEFASIYGHKGRGRPRKNAALELLGFKLTATASINPNLVDDAIEKEKCYVIATTDIDIAQNAQGALEIYQTYHEQSDIDGCYKGIKVTETFFKNFNLEKDERMKGLIAILGLAFFYQRRLMKALVKEIK